MLMLKEFKEFLARGNVVDLAVAVVIGAAFGRIVTSLVEGIIMPPIGLLLGRVDYFNSNCGHAMLGLLRGSAGGMTAERVERKRPRALCASPEIRGVSLW